MQQGTSVSIRALEVGGMQHAHFQELAPERHRELLARMAFLVTRGCLPFRAYHLANDGMVLDESEDDGTIPIEWDVVKAVADAWPDPARTPDARPVRGVVELARHVVGMVEASIEVPETRDDNRAQLPAMCLSERMGAKILALFDAETERRAAAAYVEPPAEPAAPATPDPGGGYPYDDDHGFADDGWG